MYVIQCTHEFICTGLIFLFGISFGVEMTRVCYAVSSDAVSENTL